MNSLAPVKFLRETGVSRPGILIVRGVCPLETPCFNFYNIFLDTIEGYLFHCVPSQGR